MEQSNLVRDYNTEFKFKEIKFSINIFLEELKIHKGIKYLNLSLYDPSILETPSLWSKAPSEKYHFPI